jgi:predicted PurR-regulated permease PerM
MPTTSSPGQAGPAGPAGPVDAIDQGEQVPVRTILAAVGSVLVTAAAIELFLKLQKLFIWVAVATFFAVVLHPAVDLLVRRLRLKRPLAALLVFFTGAVTFGGLGYLFVRPLVGQVNIFVNEFPRYLSDAANGQGTIGRLVKQYGLDSYVRRNQQNLRNAVKTVEKPAIHLGRQVLNTVTAAVTIIVITFIMLIEAPRMMTNGLGILSPPLRTRVRRVLHDAARTLAGYVAGVLVVSILAGAVCYLVLLALDVPFAGPLALWAGFTAVVPLVGAIIGTIPAVVIAFIHSTPAGITVLVILVVYHFAENRTLEKWINARTVGLSRLSIVVSVLAGLSLLGVLGALLAIPAAGVLNIVIRDLVAFRRERRLAQIAAEERGS